MAAPGSRVGATVGQRVGVTLGRASSSAAGLPTPADLGWSSWIDASDAAYRTVSGSDLTLLTDKILSGATFSPLVSPTIDTGTGIVTFNGTTHGMRCTHATMLGWFDGASSVDTVTIMALAKLNAVGSSYVGGYALDSDNRTGGIGTLAGIFYQITRRSTGAIGGTPDATTWHAWAGRINDATSRLVIDASTVISDTLASGGFTPSHFCVGYRTTSGGDVEFAAMDWVEQVIYAGVATDEMEAGVRNYWIDKHGLTS